APRPDRETRKEEGRCWSSLLVSLSACPFFPLVRSWRSWRLGGETSGRTPMGGPRIAVLGAGPVGLEAALYAATLGLPVTVYERGGVGEPLRQWGHVRLFSPFGMNSTPLARAAVRAARPREELPAEGDLLTGREHVSAYLEALAALPALRDSVRTETA